MIMALLSASLSALLSTSLSALFPALLFAVSTSLDAFLVGISYGLRRIRIPFAHNLIISLTALLGTILSFLMGQFLTPLLPGNVADLAGSAILIAMGAYYLIKYMCSTFPKYIPAHNRSPELCKTHEIKEGWAGQPSPSMAYRSKFKFKIQSSDMTDKTAGGSAMDSDSVKTQLRKVLLLGMALSANNIGIGTAASMAGLLLLPAAVLSLLSSLGMLSLGNRLGCVTLSGSMGKLAEPLSGVLLMGLGLSGLFEI